MDVTDERVRSAIPLRDRWNRPTPDESSFAFSSSWNVARVVVVVVAGTRRMYDAALEEEEEDDDEEDRG
jgi:hypothetical protein